MNSPVISMSFNTATPGADPELLSRYGHWVEEVYVPLNLKTGPAIGADRYKIITESPLFPSYGTVYHWENIEKAEVWRNSTENKAIAEETVAWSKRGVSDPIWRVRYRLVRSFRRGEEVQKEKLDTRIEDAPVMHLEAYLLSPEFQEKFISWFNGHGFNVFLPLFVKLPGLKGYDFYEYKSSTSITVVRNSEYPHYLSIIYFENPEAFERFTTSPERVTFQKALRNVFPAGPELKWYVQYQLVKSWRK